MNRSVEWLGPHTSPYLGDDCTRIGVNRREGLRTPTGAKADGRRDQAMSLHGGDRAFDLTETDAIAIALAPAAHHERIAIFQE